MQTSPTRSHQHISVFHFAQKGNLSTQSSHVWSPREECGVDDEMIGERKKKRGCISFNLIFDLYLVCSPCALFFSFGLLQNWSPSCYSYNNYACELEANNRNILASLWTINPPRALTCQRKSHTHFWKVAPRIIQAIFFFFKGTLTSWLSTFKVIFNCRSVLQNKCGHILSGFLWFCLEKETKKKREYSFSTCIICLLKNGDTFLKYTVNSFRFQHLWAYGHTLSSHLYRLWGWLALSQKALA